MEARLSLPRLHQWPLGTRQVASAAIGDATQFTSASQRARTKRPARYLLVDLCATEFSDWTRSVGRSYPGMLLVPVIVVAATRGSAQRSALGLYQGLVRAFQRRGKAYELRCGQLYERTIAAFADRR